MLVEQNGKIFDGLLRHLQHHSLAMLLIKLIDVQVVESKKERWDASEDNCSETNDSVAEPELTVEQKHMQ